MKNLFCTLIFITLAALSQAQENNGGTQEQSDTTNATMTAVSTDSTTKMVTITSRGSDVREVLFDLFEQSDKSFVLDPSVKQELFLVLKGIEFEEALGVVCQASGLKFELQNGIYFINKPAVAGGSTQPVNPPRGGNPPANVPIKLTDEDLGKKLTSKLLKTDIRAVFKDFSTQTGIIIDVDPQVPAYKLDVWLVGTTLKSALQTVTEAADLEFVLTNERTILIRKKRV